MNWLHRTMTATLLGCLVAPGLAHATNNSATTGEQPVAAAPTGKQKPGPNRGQQKQDLIAFNGYYALADTPGGFFSVDTNTTKSAGAKPKSLVSLIVSLDGKTSQSVDFSGTVHNNRLRQQSPNGLAFDLTFTRNSRALGPTATVAGTITLPGQAALDCSGSTYNNPIPASFWGGRKYYEQTTPPGEAPAAIAKITKQGDLLQDNGKPGSTLTKVAEYKYNVDMYYFTFADANGDTASFIMGTAGQSGFALNNMVVRDNVPISQRMSVTIPRAKAPATGNWYPEFHLTQGPNGVTVGGDITLTDYSAYYPIKTGKNTQGFVAIQGAELTLMPGIGDTVPGASPGELYRPLIAYSRNGTSAKSWYFDTSQRMSFDGRTLRMPQQDISLTFKRKYDPTTGGLFAMTGSIKNKKVSGVSLFNPVPLVEFAGTMTDVSGQHELIVTPDGEVTFDGTSVANYEYVPSMYILAGPIPGTTKTPEPVTMISFGHTGVGGIGGIVTVDYGSPDAKTYNVYTIPPKP